MSRYNETENGEIIVVIKNSNDVSMYIGYHSPVYVEKDSRSNELKYFYDAGGSKRYVKDEIKTGTIEIK